MQQCIKLGEECGELSAAVLMNAGLKGTKMNKNAIRNNVLEECCDVVLVSVSMMRKGGYSMDEIRAMIDKKLNKWNKRLEAIK